MDKITRYFELDPLDPEDEKRQQAHVSCPLNVMACDPTPTPIAQVKKKIIRFFKRRKERKRFINSCYDF